MMRLTPSQPSVRCSSYKTFVLLSPILSPHLRPSLALSNAFCLTVFSSRPSSAFYHHLTLPIPNARPLCNTLLSIPLSFTLCPSPINLTSFYLLPFLLDSPAYCLLTNNVVFSDLYGSATSLHYVYTVYIVHIVHMSFSNPIRPLWVILLMLQMVSTATHIQQLFASLVNISPLTLLYLHIICSSSLTLPFFLSNSMSQPTL